ncbi:MAG: hypothetical protein Q8S24_01475 [Eubacteriales bacterium]|nr:hypothetical protein [Eubacteriales bacterium]
MPQVIGFVLAILFFGIAVKISFFVLRVVFGLLGFIIMMTVFPVIMLPFLALFSLLSFLIVPLLVIGGVILVLKLIF